MLSDKLVHFYHYYIEMISTLFVRITFHITISRMIETHEPERAIELYKKACDVCEVLASNDLHVFCCVHNNCTYFSVNDVSPSLQLCDYISVLTTVRVNLWTFVYVK